MFKLLIILFIIKLYARNDIFKPCILTQTSCWFEWTPGLSFLNFLSFFFPLASNSEIVVCVSGGKKCLFFGNFGVLCFLETPILRVALLPYYRQNDSSRDSKKVLSPFYHKNIFYRK